MSIDAGTLHDTGVGAAGAGAGAAGVMVTQDSQKENEEKGGDAQLWHRDGCWKEDHWQ